MSTLVFKYGCLSTSSPNVDEQMFAAHRYRNVLVEIERGRRAAHRALLTVCGLATLEAAAHAAEAAVEQALHALKASRKASRKRSESDAQKNAVTEARKAKQTAVDALRAERARLRADDLTLLAERERIDELAADLRRGARALTTCHWGTYLLIEAADHQSRKMPLYKGAEPNDPKFQRWTGDGRVGVQIQGGMTADELLGGQDTRARLIMTDKKGKPDKSSKYGVLSLRVGSEGRDPVWATWPIKMHRPLPEGAIIKGFAVSRRYTGPRAERTRGTINGCAWERWSVEFTLDTSACPPREACGVGRVGVDLGWRQFSDRLRVCAWSGDDGQRGELCVPNEKDLRMGADDGALSKSEGIRSTRDMLFNAALAAYVAWTEGRIMAAWMCPRGLAQWRSPARLAALCRRWGRERFAGDSRGYEALEAWRYRDHHLWEYEAGQRGQALHARKNLYRTFAAMLARRYRTIVLEDLDLRVFAKHASPEAGAENPNARSNRHAMATSELRLCLVQAFAVRGGEKSIVKAAGTTRVCFVCGDVQIWDQAKEVVHTCTACGTVWDQDDNAADNIRERSGGGGACTPVGETRWVKARRMSAEKKARKKARKPTGNDAE